MSHEGIQPAADHAAGLADKVVLEARRRAAEQYRRLAAAGLIEHVLVCARACGDAAHDLTYDDVRSSARCLFSWVQGRLEEMRNDPDGWAVLDRHDVTAAQSLAVETLRWMSKTGTNASDAKRLHVDVSGGRPLAICIGPPLLYPVLRGEPVRRWVAPAFSSGCGAIFDVSTYVGGRNLFPRYCPDCRGNRRHPNRDAAAILRQRSR